MPMAACLSRIQISVGSVGSACNITLQKIIIVQLLTKVNNDFRTLPFIKSNGNSSHIIWFPNRVPISKPRKDVAWMPAMATLAFPTLQNFIFLSATRELYQADQRNFR
jgi:hypothetical protein